MRKHIFGRQLQRDTNERKALFKSLMSSVIVHESIITTEAKAKAVKSQLEKLVTKAKMGGINAERALQSYLSPALTKKLLTDIAPRFEKRPGGYTRIIKLDKRVGDNAKRVIFEWVEKSSKLAPQEVKVEAKEIATPKKSEKAEEVIDAEIVAEKESKPKKVVTKKTTTKVKKGK